MLRGWFSSVVAMETSRHDMYDVTCVWCGWYELVPRCHGNQDIRSSNADKPVLLGLFLFDRSTDGMQLPSLCMPYIV